MPSPAGWEGQFNPSSVGGCGTSRQVLQRPIVSAASLVSKDAAGQMASPGEQFFFS